MVGRSGDKEERTRRFSASALLEIATISSGRLPIQFVYDQDHNTIRAKTIARLASQFDRYLEACSTVPEISLTCLDIRCTSRFNVDILTVMLHEINNLRRGGLFANRIPAQDKGLGLIRKVAVNRRIRRPSSPQVRNRKKGRVDK